MDSNLEKIKEMAVLFLNQKPEPVEGFEIFVIHPVLETRVAHLSTGTMFDIFEDTDSFKQWLKETERIIQTRSTVDAVFMMIRTAYKLTFFKYVNEYLNEKDFARMLRNTWIDVEFTSDNTNTSFKERLSWFQKANSQYLMCEKDFKRWKGLKEVTTIYRGCRNQEKELGMSWTLDKEKAEWFATRLANEDDIPVIYTYDIDKKYIFAYFSERDEAEIIINPIKILRENLKINLIESW